MEDFIIDDELRREELFVDSDNDGIADILEGPGGNYPHLLVGTVDSAVDTDGDGLTDAQEILAATTPLDPTDLLEITDHSLLGLDPATSKERLEVTWKSVPGAHYIIIANPTLGIAPSKRVVFGPFIATGTRLTAEVDVNPTRDFMTIERVPGD